MRLLGSDTDFAAMRSIAPAGRAIGSANSGSNPKNHSRHQGRLFFCLLCFWRSKRKVSRPPRRQSGIRTLRSACSFDQNTFGSGRFQGQSPNSPRLRLALRVLRYASQRNCDLTLKTSRLDEFSSNGKRVRPSPQLKCLPTIPASSNIVTCAFPNTGNSFASALMARLLAASCSFSALM